MTGQIYTCPDCLQERLVTVPNDTLTAVARALAESYGLRKDAPIEALKPWLRDAKTATKAVLALTLAKQPASPDPATVVRQEEVERVARALAAAEGEHWFGSDAYKKHNNRWLKLANAAIDALAKQARPAPTDAGAALREALQEHGDFPALDEIDWNDAAHTFLSSFEQARPEPVNERLLSALKDIRDATARRQLPLTDQIWRAADSAITEATNRMGP